MLTILVCLFSSVRAQETSAAGGELPQFNAQTFRPAVDSLQFLWLNDTSLGKDNTVNFRTTLSYADSPITYYDYRGTRYELLSSVTQMDVSAGYTKGRIRYALSAPVILNATGEPVPGVDSSEISELGLGEMMADVKYQILNRYNKKVGLAVTGRSSLPTTTTDSPLGTDGVMFEVEAGLDTEIRGLTFALNLGHRQQPKVPTESVEWGPQIFARTGIARPFTKEQQSGVSAEYNYASLYSGFGEKGTSAQELVAGGWFTLMKYYQFRAGLSKGLSSGMTTPQWRGIVSVSFLKKPPPDMDGDGLSNKKDACPQQPEDVDGYQDEDGCPDPTTVFVNIISKEGEELPDMQWTSADGLFSGNNGSSFMMQSGKIDLSIDHPIYKPVTVTAKINDQEKQEVRIEVERRMGSLALVAQDELGAPVPDATWEIKGTHGVVHPASDVVPLRPGEYEIVIKAPNYKIEARTIQIVADQTEEMVLSLQPAKVSLTDINLEILDKVYFKTDSYEIDEKSHLLLDEVAEVLGHYPNVLQVRIEGHTDSRGRAKYNKNLSQGRADAVKEYLVEKGVEATRLTPVGFGEEQPIADNTTKEGRSINRRVIFVITDSIPLSEFRLQNSREATEKQRQQEHALEVIEKRFKAEREEKASSDDVVLPVEGNEASTEQLVTEEQAPVEEVITKEEEQTKEGSTESEQPQEEEPIEDTSDTEGSSEAEPPEEDTSTNDASDNDDPTEEEETPSKDALDTETPSEAEPAENEPSTEEE